MALVACGAMASPEKAQAFGPGYGYGGYGYGGYATAPVVPNAAFLAAPWYLYWPYDAHFQTPAPIYGTWYPPPNIYGGYAPPYFPATPEAYIPGAPLNSYPYTPSSGIGDTIVPVDPNHLPIGN